MNEVYLVRPQMALMKVMSWPPIGTSFMLSAPVNGIYVKASVNFDLFPCHGDKQREEALKLRDKRRAAAAL